MPLAPLCVQPLAAGWLAMLTCAVLLHALLVWRT